MNAVYRLLLVLPLAAVLVACSNGDSSTEQGAATTPAVGAAAATAAPATVTVGYIPILICAPFFVGIERGYFAEQGITVDLQALAGGADMLTQTAAGNFDVGSGGIGSAYFNLASRAQSLGQGQPITIVAPLHAERPPLTTPMVVGKKAYEEGRFTKIADLKGKKVAINALGAATEYWLERALNAGGLTIKDVEVVAIPFQNIPQALDSGAIAGAMLGEPFATLGIRQGQVQILTDSFLDGDQPTAVYYNSGWASKNPRVAQGFMVAYLKAVRDLENGGWSDPATLEILSRYTNVPAETIASASRPFGEADGTVNVTSLENQQTFFMQQGRLTYEESLEIEALIDTSYATEAVKSLGPFKPR
jgi:NitT/TauT family transport system substrate-binding protein